MQQQNKKEKATMFIKKSQYLPFVSNSDINVDNTGTMVSQRMQSNIIRMRNAYPVSISKENSRQTEEWQDDETLEYIWENLNRGRRFSSDSAQYPLNRSDGPSRQILRFRIGIVKSGREGKDDKLSQENDRNSNGVPK